MYKYEMDPTRTVGATEQTGDAGRTDGHLKRKTQMYCDEDRWRFFCLIRIIQESGVYQLGVLQSQGDSSAPSTTDPLICGFCLVTTPNTRGTTVEQSIVTWMFAREFITNRHPVADGRTDNWTDRWMDRRSETNIPPPTTSLLYNYEFWLRFHWNLFPRGPINNIPALVQIMAWHQPGDKPLSEQMMVSL